jgi:hypothetical protein
MIRPGEPFMKRSPLFGPMLLVAALHPSMGCAGRRPPNTAGAGDRSGVVSYEVVRDPNARVVQIGAHQEYTAPSPSAGLTLPAYPHDLLPLALPAVTVLVRAVIDEEGGVVAAIPSPLGKGEDDPLQIRFQEATVAAVKDWTFEPARIRSFRPSEDRDGDGRPDYEILDAETYPKVFLDLRFVFEVLEGKGIVRQISDADQKP